MRLRTWSLSALAIPVAIAAWLAWGPSPSNAPSAEPASTEAASIEPARVATANAAATPDTASAAATAAPTAAATALASTADPSTTDTRARIMRAEPTGMHIALEAPVVVTFDHAPAPDGVTLSIDPPAEGKLEWRDPQTLTFVPVAWAEGKLHRVQASGPGVAESPPFEFRPLIKPPKRIVPGNGERILFTFDDGADQIWRATALLDLLDKEQVQAIFFPTGRWVETHPHTIARIAASGHRICNHTYSHQNLRLPQLSDETIRSEIERGAGAGTCTLFRPPFRAMDPRVERIVQELGYTTYLWDIDSRDWEGLPAEDIVNRVLVRARPGAVVLFHMHGQFMLDALPVILSRLRKAGYVFRDPPSEDAGADAGAAAVTGHVPRPPADDLQP